MSLYSTSIIISIFSLFGGNIASLFFLVISKKNKIKFDKNLLIHLIIPFAPFFYKSDLGKSIKFKLSFLVGAISFLFLSFSFNNIILSTRNWNLFEVLSFALILLGIIITMLYLAIYDLINYKIPGVISTNLLFFIVILNIGIGISKILNFELNETRSFEFTQIGSPASLLGLILGYGLSYIFVKVSNEKHFGKGDLEIMAVIGGILGAKAFLVSVLIMIFVGGIAGIVYSLYKKKFKDLLVPFVPFILIGFVISLGFSDNILRLLFNT